MPEQGQFLTARMANIGPNRGRVLRTALNRFAAILIDEARTFTGMSYAELDEALGLEQGQSYRYSLYPRTGKTRAPQAASIQQLENRVAKLLKRCAHRLVIQNNKAVVRGLDEVIGAPRRSHRPRRPRLVGSPDRIRTRLADLPPPQGTPGNDASLPLALGHLVG